MALAAGTVAAADWRAAERAHAMLDEALPIFERAGASYQARIRKEPLVG